MERLNKLLLACDISDAVQKLVTPTYLNTLTVKDALLVCKESKFGKHVENGNTYGDCGSTNGVDLNVTGNPLECSFGIDYVETDSSVAVLPRNWQKDEENYLPFTLQEARSFLSDYNVSCAEEEPIRESLWVVCDGLDASRTILLSSHIDQKREWYTRSIVTVCENISMSQMQSFSEKITKHHFSVSKIPRELTTHEILCTYEIYGSRNAGNGENSSKIVDGHGSVFLEMSWENNSIKRTVMKPPLEACTIVDVMVTIGQNVSEAFSLWQQLEVLLQLHDNLVKSDSKMSVNSFSKEGVLEQVISLVKTPTHANHQWGMKDKDTFEDLHFIDIVIAVSTNGRQNADFTHKLWRLLAYSKDHEELLDCLTVVLEGVKTGTCSPRIDPQNTSQIASAIKSQRTSSVDVDLTTMNPFKILLEIGIESLEKDYMHILLASQVATFDNLYYKDSENLQDRLTWLCRMHSVVEFILVTQITLCLPPRGLHLFVVALLDKFVSSSNKSTYDIRCDRNLKFRHPIRTLDIESIISTREYNSCRISLNSSGETNRATTVLHCGYLPIFPPALLDPDCSQNIQNMSLNSDIIDALHCTLLKSYANKLG